VVRREASALFAEARCRIRRCGLWLDGAFRRSAPFALLKGFFAVAWHSSGIGRLNGFSYATLGKIFGREFFDGQAR
jgi:hypothetical protein